MATPQYQVYYGITLGEGSVVENFHIEQLAADPVPAQAGRAWYNTTDKKWKQSTLDANGAVIIRTFATEEGLTASVTAVIADLNAEIARAQAAEAQLTSDLAAEVSRAQAAESLLTTDLAAEAARATAAEATELARATAAEAVLQSNIDAEEARALAAEQSLGLRIDALGSAFNYVGTVVGGADAAAAVDLGSLSEKDPGDYYKVTTAGYFKVGSGAAFFANIGDGLVFNLANGIDKIDNTNSEVTGVASFVSVTGAADTGFVVDIDSAFKGRVSTLETGLAQELVDRAAGDSALDARVTTVEGQVNGKIGELSTLTTTEKGTIVGAINELDSDLAAEVVSRTAADTGLQNSIDALQSELDATQVGSGLGTDGSYSANVSANYISAAVSLKDADNKLDAALKVVADNLASEASRATAAEGQIRTDYNARKAVYTSTSPALVHEFAHNLGTQDVAVSLLIKRADGKYYNDQALFEITDNNTIKVYVTAAKDIKLMVESFVAI